MSGFRPESVNKKSHEHQRNASSYPRVFDYSLSFRSVEENEQASPAALKRDARVEPLASVVSQTHRSPTAGPNCSDDDADSFTVMKKPET